MKRLFAAVLFLLPAACASRDPRQAVMDRVLALGTDDDAFQDLIRGGGSALDLLKDALSAAPNRGFPLVAVLYAEGEGDAVPLDLKARHYASFRWPTAHADENALVEPAVWDELERDLLLAGRHALGFLAGALAKDSPDERTALRTARIMMRIGGRPAMEAFAGLLEADRALGGPRVRDVAAAALLVLAAQDLPLRQADPDAIARFAREWWAAAKDRPDDAWIRESAAALAAKRAEKDPEGVEPVLELLEGKGTRGEAFAENRRRERATGLSAWMPAWERIGDLRAALRLWAPPADLDARWKRLLRGGLLRLTVAAVGRRPKDGAGAVLWARETFFHASENDAIDLRIAGDGYSLHVRTREFGTGAVVAEFARSGKQGYGRLYEASVVRPHVHYSPILKSAVIVAVDEVESRRPPPPPDGMKLETRKRLKALEEAGGDGAKALAYFQDPKDLPWFRERKAGAALLMLGDPAALELKPSLEIWEIDLALKVSKEPAVLEYLEALRSAPRP
jgi:hypothetical protein